MEQVVKPADVAADGDSPAMSPAVSADASPPMSKYAVEMAAIASGAWDGIERRTALKEVNELRGRLVSQLNQRRLVWRVATHAGVLILATLAAFGACWIASLVINAATFSPSVRQAMEIGAMVASGAAAVIGAVVSWKIGWRSFFVGWLVGGKLYLAAMMSGF